MVRLQLGIRVSIGRIQQQQQQAVSAAAHARTNGTQNGQPAAGAHPTSALQQLVVTPLEQRDFTDKAKIFFPASGSANTPAHASSDFKWKDYSPKVGSLDSGVIILQGSLQRFSISPYGTLSPRCIK